MINKVFKKKLPISANKFLNIKDIQGNFLYTTDGKVLAYLKIYPKNCKLMSKLHTDEALQEILQVN